MLSGDSGVRSANASVTITTAFSALAHVGQDCFLNITHVLRPGAGGGHSRVRIDSLCVHACTRAWPRWQEWPGEDHVPL